MAKLIFIALEWLCVILNTIECARAAIRLKGIVQIRSRTSACVDDLYNVI